ncbi:MAG: hypothetical protein QW076_02315 [Candidatus Anstonellales archaeon]
MNLKGKSSKIQEFKTALLRNNLPVIEQLIKEDRSLVNFIDDGWHILSTAVFYSSSSSVAALIRNGADIKTAYYRSKEDPLLLAITKLGMTKESRDSKKAFKLLLNAYDKAGIPIHSYVNESLLTYLSHACRVGSMFAVNELSQYYFTEENKSLFYLLTKNNPIFIALANKNEEILQYLLHQFIGTFSHSLLDDERLFKEMLFYLRDINSYLVLMKEIRFNTSYDEDYKSELIELMTKAFRITLKFEDEYSLLMKALARIME